MNLRFLACFASMVAALEAQPGGNLSSPADEPTVKAVAKAMPAVVNINTESVIRRAVQDPMDAIYENFYGRAMRPTRMIKQTVQSLGSGFFIDPTGYIVTNAHVVERASEMKIAVTTQDGKTYNARYITGDPDHDLALLKVEGKQPFPFISLSDISENLLGETCLVLGNPLGYGSSVARGILSAKGRSVTVGEVEYENLVQTDAAINPGNSGGPIVDIAGRLVGVSSVKMSYTPQGVPTQGLGFAIPGDVVRDKVEDLRKVARGEKLPPAKLLTRKYFGLTLQELDEKLAANLGYPSGSGALIAEVEKGSPAQVAGVEVGMLLTSVGRYEVSSAEQVEKLFRKLDSGSRVDLGVSVWRKVGRRQALIGDTIRIVAR